MSCARYSRLRFNHRSRNRRACLPCGDGFRRFSTRREAFLPAAVREGRGDAREALLGASGQERSAIIATLRQSYTALIHQAESSGNSRDAVTYRDNLSILDAIGGASPPARRRSSRSPLPSRSTPNQHQSLSQVHARIGVSAPAPLFLARYRRARPGAAAASRAGTDASPEPAHSCSAGRAHLAGDTRARVGVSAIPSRSNPSHAASTLDADQSRGQHRFRAGDPSIDRAQAFSAPCRTRPRPISSSTQKI